MLNDSPFTTSNPQKIIKYLSLLIANNRLITAHIGNEGESFITVLFELDGKNKQVLFDLGPDAQLNRKIVNSAAVQFTTEYHGISVAFKAAHIKQVSCQGKAAFAMPLPASMLWQERREYYRVRLPLSQVGECLITHADKTTSRFNIYDISISGFAILLETQDPATISLFSTGKQFEQAYLTLPGSNPVEVASTICGAVTLNSGKAHKLIKVGCKFNKISFAGESTIQRYMQKIELEKNR